MLIYIYIYQAILSGRVLSNLEIEQNALQLLQDKHSEFEENEKLTSRLQRELGDLFLEKNEMTKNLFSCRSENKKLIGEILRLTNELRAGEGCGNERIPLTAVSVSNTL